MKEIFYLLLAYFLFQLNIFAQSGWNLIYTFDQQISSIAFKDSLNGFASGAVNAKIYETDDGGITWTIVNIPSLDDIISHLIFYNTDMCFGVGKNGTIIKSIDKGKTWTVGNVGDKSELRTIYAAPGGNLFICQRSGNYIYKSTDQGISWTKTFSNGTGYQYDFGFCDENVGYLVGDAIVKTTDGGNNWFSVNNNFYSGIHKRIKFISDKIGYEFVASYPSSKIAKTTDGGNNWFEVYNNQNSPQLNDFTVSGENTIWAVGYHTILKSTTSGSKWIHQSFSPYTDLYKVVSINPLICYALSSVGTLYKTIDGGLTAPSLSYPPNQSTELPLNNLFKWISETSGNPFRIQIAMDPSFNSLYLDTLINSTSLQIKTPELNTVYYWRVCERFGISYTPWSEIWSFRTTASDIPLLTSPLNNSMDLNLTLLLSWNDPTLTANSYQIQVSSNSEFNNLFFDSTTSNEYIEIQDLLDSALYYWRVRANINNEYRAWSEVWKFTTLAKTARLLKPSNNSVKSPINNITFEWSRTAETMEFILQISSDSTFYTNVIEKKDLTVFSTNITENLNYNTKYFWRVGAKNFDGKTYWSKVFIFYTKQAPTASFPLSLGNKWYYQAGSNHAGYYYGVVKKITDTLSDGFREVTDTYYYEEDSINTQKEYWGYIDGKFYIGHQTSNYVYDDYLADDTCVNGGFSHGCRLLIPYKLFNISDTAQFCSNYFSMHGASDGNETTILPGIGIVKTFHSSYSYSGIVTKDSTYLIGMLRNGEILGDTTFQFPADTNVLITKFELYQNYPNPFNPVTYIKYDLPQDGHIQLKIYDILGREIKTLVNEERPAGRYKVEFNGSSYSSGIYFYRIKTGNYSSVKKMILLR